MYCLVQKDHKVNVTKSCDPDLDKWLESGWMDGWMLVHVEMSYLFILSEFISNVWLEERHNYEFTQIRFDKH